MTETPGAAADAAPSDGDDEPDTPQHRTALPLLTLGALGVVYGDIGTSPLYAMRESFEGSGHQLQVTHDNVLGILSLIVWSLIIIISIKYLVFVMKADNDGEGGILVLTSLIPHQDSASKRRRALVMLGLFGTALLYGDGMITPAISVLSAIEGTEVAAPALADYAVPIAIVILIGLFAVQRFGTGSVGRAFGPVMVLWFSVLGLLGIVHIVQEPAVFAALNPVYGFQFFLANGMTGFLALGSVFLVVTGGEALYADMGHFGRRPIAVGWFSLVLPGLLLNYFGQGALLIGNPEAIDNPFYRLAPSWASIPLVVLATVATVIASQALISGAFSLTMQASQFGYLPRVKVTHTSAKERGQIYVPMVNWVLMVSCVGLVLGFKSSTNLAAAYGVAVTLTMIITTLLFYLVLREHFGWTAPKAMSLCGAFLVVDLAFFGANIPKIPHGGWFPLIVGGFVFALLTTWFTGRRVVRQRHAPRPDAAAGVPRGDQEPRAPARLGHGGLPVRHPRPCAAAAHLQLPRQPDLPRAHPGGERGHRPGTARPAGRAGRRDRPRARGDPGPAALRVHGGPARRRGPPAPPRRHPRGHDLLPGSRDARHHPDAQHGAVARAVVRVHAAQLHERGQLLQPAARPGARDLHPGRDLAVPEPAPTAAAIAVRGW